MINNTSESEGTLKTSDKNSDKNLITEIPIKPHEQRALNFLINEYLLARSCKLTSITFSDENENQDFEDWQDVGLNISKPAGLLQIYREYMKANGYDKAPSVTVAVQTDFVVNEIEEKKDELLEMVCFFRFGVKMFPYYYFIIYYIFNIIIIYFYLSSNIY